MVWTTKVCPKCGIEKSRDAYGSLYRHSATRQSYCKACRSSGRKQTVAQRVENKQMRAYIAANPRRAY